MARVNGFHDNSSRIMTVMMIMKVLSIRVDTLLTASDPISWRGLRRRNETLTNGDIISESGCRADKKSEGKLAMCCN